MGDFLQDIRYALRALVRQPGFTVVAVLSLGIGIGAVTTIFLWTDRWVFRPLPVVEQVDRLVELRTKGPGGERWSVAYPTARDWKERNRVFEALAVFNLNQVGVRVEGGGTERAWGLLASESFFDVLGVKAARGRTFQPGEEASAAQVAVLGHSYWERRFRADSAVIGRALTLNGHDFTIVGVLPPAFSGAYVGLTMDFYAPITTRTLLDGQMPWEQRGRQWLDGLARLKPGVTLAAAAADLERVGRELDVIYPNDANTGLVRPLVETGASAVLLPVLFALLGVTVLVLLIACANVANLLLARATARQRELGVRLAIGAGRGRIVRQLLTESLVLGLAGGVVGLYLAYLGADAMRLFIPPAPYPIQFDTAVNLRVVLAAMGITLATVVLFGLAPALRASRPDLVPVLKQLPSGGGRGRFRGGLVVAQVALSLVTLVCAGLFLRGLARAQQVDPGFEDPDGILLVSTDMHMAGLRDSLGPAVLERLLEGLRALPGVQHASASTFVPLGFGGDNSAGVMVEGYAPAEGENLSVQYARVTRDYFATMGTAIVQGRGIDATDRAGATSVAVVNQRFAERFWKGQDPIGKRFRQSGTWHTVVGVAQTGKYRQLTEAPRSMVYRAMEQDWPRAMTIHLRVTGSPRSHIEPVRKAFESADASLPFLDPRSMREQIIPATIGQRMGSRMLALFGGVALFLAAIGLSGVLAYSVNQRRREIGVRLALGADARDVVRMVLGHGYRLTGIGVLLGAVLALGAGQLLRGQLFGLSPADPVTFGVLALVLGVVAGIAGLIPARRAARVDPVVVLRSD